MRLVPKSLYVSSVVWARLEKCHSKSRPSPRSAVTLITKFPASTSWRNTFLCISLSKKFCYSNMKGLKRIQLNTFLVLQMLAKLLRQNLAFLGCRSIEMTKYRWVKMGPTGHRLWGWGLVPGRGKKGQQPVKKAGLDIGASEVQGRLLFQEQDLSFGF